MGIIRQGRLIAVEHVADLKSQAKRQVEIIFDGPAPMEKLELLSNVEQVTRTDGRAQLIVEGTLDPVLEAIQGHHVRDIINRGPDLQQVFLKFYREREHVS